jgi:hypothetical protein
MGVTDHKRTWHVETSAAPDDCVRAFVDSLTGSTGLLLGSRWQVVPSGGDGSRSAVATYQGRAGLIGAVTALSRRAAREEALAVGSQLSFTATAGPTGTTTCTMGMTRVAQVMLFFIADARFFRAAMKRVVRRLRELDADLAVVRS